MMNILFKISMPPGMMMLLAYRDSAPFDCEVPVKPEPCYGYLPVHVQY